MTRTKTFRDQHEKILDMVSDISGQLDPDRLSEDAREIKSSLARLFGIINVHLAMEDKSLYPNLLKNNDEKISSTARDFVAQMGDLLKVVDKYKKKWPTASAIQKNPCEFIKETKASFAALEKRIKRENKELYIMIDNQ